jgi:hypothetical protein
MNGEQRYAHYFGVMDAIFIIGILDYGIFYETNPHG